MLSFQNPLRLMFYSKKNIKYCIIIVILWVFNLFFWFLNLFFVFLTKRALLITKFLKLFLFLEEVLRNGLVWFYWLMLFGDEKFDDIWDWFEFFHSFLVVTSTLIRSLSLNKSWHFYVFIETFLLWVL